MGIARTTRVTDGGNGQGGKMPGGDPAYASLIAKTSAADSILTGLLALSAEEWNGSDAGNSCRVRPWVTASVLSRLGELEFQYIASVPGNKVEKSLDYLERLQIPGSGWGENGTDGADALTTSWTIIALRSHRRSVPSAAVDFLLRCRQSDGSFSSYPASEPDRSPAGPEITVTALRALNTCDRAAGDFLASSLRNDLSSRLAHKSSRFYLCSEILDWEAGLAPWPLLQLVAQSAVQFDMEGAYEQALLLRILRRMRNQRAWVAAAALRKMQLADGSWPAFAPVAPHAATEPLSATENKLLTAATAISALAMSDVQTICYSTPEASQAGKWGAE